MPKDGTPWLAQTVQLFKNALKNFDETPDQTIDLQCGKTVWHNVAPKMRTELWLSILHRKGIGSKASKRFREYLGKPLTQEVAADIGKDVDRTFPNIARFCTDAGKYALECVLRAYAALDPEVGYCQGMNFLAGLLLCWLPSPADAFGALVVVMQERGLRELYKRDLAMLQVRLWQCGQMMPHQLGRHMEMHGALPVLFVSSWLLTAFAADFPLSFTARIMDAILADSYVEPVMKVVMGVLKACEDRLLAMGDMEEMVDFLKMGVPCWPREVLQELLTEALATPWSPQQQATLQRVAGAESVIDAVRRVAEGKEAAPEVAIPAANLVGRMRRATTDGLKTGADLVPPPLRWTTSLNPGETGHLFGPDFRLPKPPGSLQGHHTPTPGASIASRLSTAMSADPGHLPTSSSPSSATKKSISAELAAMGHHEASGDDWSTSGEDWQAAPSTHSAAVQAAPTPASSASPPTQPLFQHSTPTSAAASPLNRSIALGEGGDLLSELGAFSRAQGGNEGPAPDEYPSSSGHLSTAASGTLSRGQSLRWEQGIFTPQPSGTLDIADLGPAQPAEIPARLQNQDSTVSGTSDEWQEFSGGGPLAERLPLDMPPALAHLQIASSRSGSRGGSGSASPLSRHDAHIASQGATPTAVSPSQSGLAADSRSHSPQTLSNLGLSPKAPITPKTSSPAPSLRSLRSKRHSSSPHAHSPTATASLAVSTAVPSPASTSSAVLSPTGCSPLQPIAHSHSSELAKLAVLQGLDELARARSLARRSPTRPGQPTQQVATPGPSTPSGLQRLQTVHDSPGRLTSHSQSSQPDSTGQPPSATSMQGLPDSQSTLAARSGAGAMHHHCRKPSVGTQERILRESISSLEDARQELAAAKVRSHDLQSSIAASPLLSPATPHTASPSPSPPQSPTAAMAHSPAPSNPRLPHSPHSSPMRATVVLQRSPGASPPHSRSASANLLTPSTGSSPVRIRKLAAGLQPTPLPPQLLAFNGSQAKDPPAFIGTSPRTSMRSALVSSVSGFSSVPVSGNIEEDWELSPRPSLDPQSLAPASREGSAAASSTAASASRTASAAGDSEVHITGAFRPRRLTSGRSSGQSSRCTSPEPAASSQPSRRLVADSRQSAPSSQPAQSIPKDPYGDELWASDFVIMDADVSDEAETGLHSAEACQQSQAASQGYDMQDERDKVPWWHMEGDSSPASWRVDAATHAKPIPTRAAQSHTHHSQQQQQRHHPANANKQHSQHRSSLQHSQRRLQQQSPGALGSDLHADSQWQQKQDQQTGSSPGRPGVCSAEPMPSLALWREEAASPAWLAGSAANPASSAHKPAAASHHGQHAHPVGSPTVDLPSTSTCNHRQEASSSGHRLHNSNLHGEPNAVEGAFPASARGSVQDSTQCSPHAPWWDIRSSGHAAAKSHSDGSWMGSSSKQQSQGGPPAAHSNESEGWGDFVEPEQSDPEDWQVSRLPIRVQLAQATLSAAHAHGMG
ncbi:hypothetical protein WJX74_010845 [Apatococcus lobatus]|uniref:Rab-GAP TBC domain-containing protein n=1 Tax=Apatococcus lobatus TaxID=904363 RepID=A0AAW1S012_9CHLO